MIMYLYTKSGLLIANNFARIVTNDFGASYYEITSNDLISQNIFVPEKKKWNLKFINQKNQNTIDYIEYRTVKDYIKIYYQLRTVDYADYKIGFYYVSIKELFKQKSKICTLTTFMEQKE